jgi:preprotein translocase subunit SecY
MYMKNYGFLTARGNSVFGAFVIILCYAAGASLIMWLAEKINEKGIGNGISMILFANIIASTAGGVSSMVTYALGGAWQLVLIEVLLFLALAIIAFVVFITNSERRLPVQYAKKQVGRKMYGGQSTTLPIKLNMSGVMPIIFASSIVSIPSTIEMIIASRLKKDGFWDKFFDVFSYNSPVYAILFFILIIAFAYFYILISFNPIEVANNLKKNGGFIPGYRPGKPTSDYIAKILSRLTLMGALLLSVVALFPTVFSQIATACLKLGGVEEGLNISLGGTSIIIMVGVALETVKQLESQMMMRHYKGFLD